MPPKRHLVTISESLAMHSSSTDWPEVSVSDVVERHFCGPSPDCEERRIFDDGEWGVLKTTAITWSGWNEEAHKVLPRAYWGQTGIEVHAGDVLVTKAGPRQRVGVVTHVPSTRRQLVVSGKMIALRPRTSLVLPEILAGLLALPTPQKFIHDRTTGMAESQVNFANDVLLNAPLRIPPMADQLEIARIGTALDTTIRETEAIIEKLKLVKEGLLHDLLTRGIDANGELRPPQSQAPHLYKDSPLGWIPKAWAPHVLGQVLTGGTRNGLYKPSSFHGSGPLMVQMGGMFRGDAVDFQSATRVRVTRPELNAFGLEVGDLLFARRSLTFEGAGQCAIVRDLPEASTFESSIVRARVDRSRVEPEFAALFLRGALSSTHRRTLIRQVAVSGVSSDDIQHFLIALPDLTEQAAIIGAIASAQGRIEQEATEVRKLSLQKSGLMDDLLTGRVRVTPLLDANSAP